MRGVDSLLPRVYGPAKQGAGFGHAKVGGYSVKLRGLSPLVAAISTDQAAPVVAATRLRGGNAASARSAASLVKQAIVTARAAGAAGRILVRGDSPFGSGPVVSAPQGRGDLFPDPAVQPQAAGRHRHPITEAEWTPVRYLGAVFDQATGRWISNAEVAETIYTAFESTIDSVTARLIVRRVRELNPAPPGQEELFPVWRHHAFLTDTDLSTVHADQTHRGHAIIKQLFADLIDGPLAHMPSNRFATNAAWLALAAMTHNLIRAAGCLTGTPHANARAATIRRQLINVPARIAHRAQCIIGHLPTHWPWQQHRPDPVQHGARPTTTGLTLPTRHLRPI